MKPRREARPSDPEHLDPDFVPFTLDELVAADVLLGVSDGEAQSVWTEGRANIEQERRSPSGNAFGVTLAEGTLLALSLLSNGLARRVERLRTRGREEALAHWRRTLPAEEVERRVAEWRSGDREWSVKREEMRRALERDGGDAGGSTEDSTDG